MIFPFTSLRLLLLLHAVARSAVAAAQCTYEFMQGRPLRSPPRAGMNTHSLPAATAAAARSLPLSLSAVCRSYGRSSTRYSLSLSLSLLYKMLLPYVRYFNVVKHSHPLLFLSAAAAAAIAFAATTRRLSALASSAADVSAEALSAMLFSHHFLNHPVFICFRFSLMSFRIFAYAVPYFAIKGSIYLR